MMQNLIDRYFPVRVVKRCGSDRPWVTDDFRNMIVKRQHALKSGHLALYRWYRNRVNTARKHLQRRYYRDKVSELSASNPRQWWREIKQLTGTNKGRSNLQGLANIACGGDMQELAQQTNTFFRSVYFDLTPIVPGDTFHIGPDCSVPNRLSTSVNNTERIADVPGYQQSVWPRRNSTLDPKGIRQPAVWSGVLPVQQQLQKWLCPRYMEVC